jgi:repressor LexA
MTISDIQTKVLEAIKAGVESGESLSMRELGDRFSLSANTILYHIKKLEEEGLLVRDSNGRVVRVNSPDEKQAVAFLPLLARARCGKPLNEVVDENTARLVPVPLYLLGRNSKQQLYLVKAVGDSMSPKIEDGDLVAFEVNPLPEVNRIIVARTSQGFTIKQFFKTDSQVVLKPLNQKYEPLVFEKSQVDQDFNIDGVAVSVIKSQRNL